MQMQAELAQLIRGVVGPSGLYLGALLQFKHFKTIQL
jgi:hypothetical protein